MQKMTNFNFNFSKLVCFVESSIFFYLFCLVLAYTINILYSTSLPQKHTKHTNTQNHTTFLACGGFLKKLKCFVLAYTIKILIPSTQNTQNHKKNENLLASLIFVYYTNIIEVL